VGYSALLDNDRHVVTVGGGYAIARLAEVFPVGLKLDLAFQYHYLVERSDRRKLQWAAPDGGVVYGGHVFGISLSGALEF
jgi:hypothetical protein